MVGLPMVDNTTFVNIIPCTMAAKHKHSNKNLGFSFKLMVFLPKFQLSRLSRSTKITVYIALPLQTETGAATRSSLRRHTRCTSAPQQPGRCYFGMSPRKNPGNPNAGNN